MIFGLLGSLLIIPVWIFAFIGKIITGDSGPVIITIVRVGKMADVFIIINSEQCIWMLCQDAING